MPYSIYELSSFRAEQKDSCDKNARGQSKFSFLRIHLPRCFWSELHVMTWSARRATLNIQGLPRKVERVVKTSCFFEHVPPGIPTMDDYAPNLDHDYDYDEREKNRMSLRTFFHWPYSVIKCLLWDGIRFFAVVVEVLMQPITYKRDWHFKLETLYCGDTNVVERWVMGFDKGNHTLRSPISDVI